MHSDWKLPAVVLAAFAALTVYAVYAQGYFAFYALFFGDPIGLQVFFDLVIALVLFAIWMVGDARERGLPVVPYLIAIPLTGSLAALVYLVHRGLRAHEAPGAQAR